MKELQLHPRKIWVTPLFTLNASASATAPSLPISFPGEKKNKTHLKRTCAFRSWDHEPPRSMHWREEFTLRHWANSLAPSLPMLFASRITDYFCVSDTITVILTWKVEAIQRKIHFQSFCNRFASFISDRQIYYELRKKKGKQGGKLLLLREKENFPYTPRRVFLTLSRRRWFSHHHLDKTFSSSCCVGQL
jgi:hypothetical protein